mmetsp:Transcript_10330/g.11864  ORF Transcript_10330/g.11864 Transcript_10330/m.11864 type:complete len:266 (-) Transcript_10330:210-1007(-)|eukprot:CAMPEP_0184019904 /NCGR_PEP_ID=MMETSP0954-20121128/9030_1 /TAXON_ID=627963 /ORGANISM="Aplanochytrium sp, Strain PBS07" /LENGTH=265 /DNA_ID=CAMNT_0026301661 /DNA_START=103 /DNA_END=900 /DNA_ORIENTATION=+
MVESKEKVLKRSAEESDSEEESSLKKVKLDEVVDEDTAGENLIKEISATGKDNATDKPERKVIIILDGARLEPVKTSKGSYELLNCDDHLHLHKKLKRDPIDSRPDICHQMLLMLMDSPLNKKGYLQVYIRTQKNILIEVSPHCRIPRTFKRFAGLMVQLLHKMKIKAADGNMTLLKVIKNPVTRHLPVNSRVFGTTVTGTLVDTHDFTAALPDKPVVFIFGAIAHGAIDVNYADQMLSFSEYPLSGAVAVSRLLNGFERKWGIL